MGAGRKDEILTAATGDRSRSGARDVPARSGLGTNGAVGEVRSRDALETAATGDRSRFGTSFVAQEDWDGLRPASETSFASTVEGGLR